MSDRSGVSRVPPMPPVTATRTRRRDTELRFLRYLPGDTVVHRLWAGTKILAVGAVSLALSLRPTWRAIGIVGVIVVAALIAARIPRGAAPRIPGWIVSVLLMGGLVSVMWGPEPHRRILGVSVSPRAADQWTRLLLVGVELLVLAAVVAWTTRLGDLAPAMRRLLRPFRVLRLPVDELTVAVALCVRCFPLLAEELRILLAARRLRPELREGGFRAAMREPIDLLVAATTVCLRRSREMADAIEARGGFGEVSDGVRGPRLRDGIVLAALALCIAFVAILGR
jgi:energy-coupling factor transport system permease protein